MAEAQRLDPEDLLAHVDWMRRLARALVYDHADADDLAQEGMRVAIETPPVLDRPVRPWLAGVVHNLVRMRARARGRRERYEANAATLSQVPSSPEQVAERVEAQRLVAKLVLALEEPFRSTVLLRYYEGRSAADIAREQGIPPGTVRWRLKQGLDRVRVGLDEAHDGDRERWRAILLPLGGAGGADPVGWPGTRGPLPVAVALVLVVTVLGAGAVIRARRHSTVRHQAANQVTVARHPVRLLIGRGGARVALLSAVDPPGGLRIVGQVVDSAGTSVAGAVVAIDASPPRSVTSDTSGRFSFAELQPRSYGVEAQAGDLFAGPVAVRAVADGGVVVLHARPAGRVRVDVRATHGGAPIVGAQVELRGTLVWRAYTDADGVAILSGVGAGWRRLRVDAAGFAPAAQMVITQGRGDTRVPVRMASGVAAGGRVVDATGAPVAGAQVWARAATEPFPVIDPALDAVTSDEGGRWLIPALAPGSYQFIAAHRDHAQTATPPMPLGGRERTDVVIRLQSGGRVLGEVRTRDGHPVVAAQVRAAALSETLPSPWQEVREAFTDDAGHFVLTGLGRRPAQLVATHDDGASEMATVDLTGVGEARVVLTLTALGRVDGVVVDGRGAAVPEARVAAEPIQRPPPGQHDPWDLRPPPLVIADARGEFSFTGLVDGEYRLRAAPPSAPPDSLALQPATTARPGERGIRVVAHGDGTVSGRVQFDDGTPVTQFSVKARGAKPTPFASADGGFSLQIPEGEQQIVVSGPAFVTRTVDRVRVTEGGNTDVGVVQVARGRAVNGRVLGLDGQPVVGAQVAVGRQLTGSGTRLYIPTESIDARETTTDEAGRFSIAGLRDSPLVVAAQMDGVGRSRPSSVPRGAGGAELDLRLVATGALEGRVLRDGRPFADTVVIATPAFMQSNYFVTSGPDGRFAFDMLAAGEHTLLVFLGRTKDSLGRRVVVEAGRRTQADLDVRSGSLTVTARVETPEHERVAGAQVVLVSLAFDSGPGDTWEDLVRRIRPPEEPMSTALRPAPQGAAVFEHMLPATYTACATVSKQGDAERPFRCTTRDVRGDAEIVVTLPAR
jgi:RNA polymerase sigma-70 factor (ECF subfamily)